MKKQMKQIALPLFLGGLIACSPKTAVNETDLLGNWTEILPPSSNFVQGMTLAKEGKASSIGMATLQYESWQRKEKPPPSAWPLCNMKAGNFCRTDSSF